VALKFLLAASQGSLIGLNFKEPPAGSSLECTKTQTDLAAANAASPYHPPPTRFIPRGSEAPVGG
jgi:hypothetical protein